MKPLAIILTAAFCAISGLGLPARSANPGPVALSWLGGGAPSVPASVAWGVPWPRGSVAKDARIILRNASGERIAAQTWPMAYWPDGSIKWTGMAIAADANTTGLTVAVGDAADASGKIEETSGTRTSAVVTVADDAQSITVNTGPLSAQISKTGQNLIASLTSAGREVARNGRLVVLREDRSRYDAEGILREEYYVSAIRKVSVEQAGPVRAVVKIEGMHAAGNNQHAREWLPFTVRLYFTAGLDSMRMAHTFIYDGNQTDDFIKGIGLALSVPFREEIQNRHIRFATDNHNLFSEPVMMAPGYSPRSMKNAVEYQRAQIAGKRIPNLAALPEKDRANLLGTPTWDSFKLTQLSADTWDLAKRTNPKSSWLRITSGNRARGLAYLGDVTGGLAIGLKNFWQKYPASFEITNASSATGEIKVWFWSPDAPAMDMRHYDIVRPGDVTYEDTRDIKRADAHGCANTSELTLWATSSTPASDTFDKMADAGSAPPLLICSPEYYHSTRTLGNWSLPNTPIAGLTAAETASVETQLDRAFTFFNGEVERRRWYGFWDFGDYRRTYDDVRNQWMYDIGGHGWNATELIPNTWLWLAFLRSGRADIFRAAEDMTRNTMEVDVYHIGRFAGLGSRHNVTHWGDGAKEPRINMAHMKRFYYYLTTDERMGDLISEPISTVEGSITRELWPDPMPGTDTLVRIGPDWMSLASNWFAEWERTGDVKYRDYCLAGMRAIGMRPEILLRNENCWLNPGTKTLTSTGEPSSANLHFRFVFGGDLIAKELISQIECPEFERAWNSFCEREAAGIRGRGYYGSRLVAYAAATTGRDDLRKKAVAMHRQLLKYGDSDDDYFAAEPLLIDDSTVAQPTLVNPGARRSPASAFHVPEIAQWAINLIVTPELFTPASQARTGNADARLTATLAGAWRFQLDPKDEGVKEAWFKVPLNDTMRLPGTTDEQRKGFPNEARELMHLTRVNQYAGAAWYQRDIEIPEAWRDKRITLSLERTKTTTVWLDDRELGTQDSLTASHIYELSGAGAITPGKHRLTIRVDNKNNPPVGDPHQISDQTQTNWNGIVGRIELKAADRVWIDDVRIQPDVPGKKIRLRLRFGNDLGIPVRGALSISGRSWNTAKPQTLTPSRIDFQAKADGTFETDFDMGGDAQLWSEFSPALYKLTVAFEQKHDGRTLTDSVETDFGMREFTTRGTQFAINGQTVFLRGKHDACVFPLTGYAPMDVDEWVRIMRIAKSYGINHYRFHTWCPPAAAFAAADIVGIYMQPELPIWGPIGTPATIDKNDVEQRPDNDGIGQRTRYLTAEGRRILAQFGNHASFVMFALGNEISGSREVMARMLDAFRSCDNPRRRLYAQGSNNFFNAPRLPPADDYFTTFMTGGHYSAGDFKDDTKGKLVRGSTAVHTTGHINNTLAGTTSDFRNAIKNVPVPVIGHETGQFQVFPDFREIAKYTGVVQARNFEVFRERLDAAGMLDQADDFFRASGALSVICYREDIEAALRTPGFGGFQLLDLQDFPGQGTALVGILDAFMDSKGLVAPAKWRQFCSETVPLLRFQNWTWTNTQTLHAAALVANYGPAALKNIQPRWSLIDAGGKELAAGNLARADIPQGELASVGEITIDLKTLVQSMPQKLELTLALPGTDYRNSYPIWVYPEITTPAVPSDDVTIARAFDRQVRDTLARGGKVLLLPDAAALHRSIPGAFITDFWCYPMFKKYNPPGTMGILCDPKHPAFAQFPTEFHSNWQWWRLTKNARAMILDDLPKSLRPVVQVIDNFERNHKLALLWEARVGNGKLLVCTSNLLSQQDAPEVRQFYLSILAYAKSPAFAPSVGVDLSDLEKMFSGSVR